ncbi:hypothetical protein PF007_g32033 [Phytophthora fragariae]|uniref:Uncharacterized protein n=2 Tax=Phytophthora fragariae TaxID=53985 RepID=A0A6A3PA31_9STRA|nr:hypothetical protein PF007_g32033 [Phytophthora fragariae]
MTADSATGTGSSVVAPAKFVDSAKRGTRGLGTSGMRSSPNAVLSFIFHCMTSFPAALSVHFFCSSRVGRPMQWNPIARRRVDVS